MLSSEALQQRQGGVGGVKLWGHLATESMGERDRKRQRERGREGEGERERGWEREREWERVLAVRWREGGARGPFLGGGAA